MIHAETEVFLTEGHSGCVEYFRKHAETPESTDWFIAAILINRFKFFVTISTPVVLFEHAWHELLSQLEVALNGSSRQQPDDFERAEMFGHSLFEVIINPIFGWIDSREKAEMISEVSLKHRESISSLKTLCQDIGAEMTSTPIQNNTLRKNLLNKRLEDSIVVPLTDLLRQPKRNAQQFIKDVITDSTVLGGLLSISGGFSAETVGLATAAGAISVSAKYFFSDKQARSTVPAAILVDGLRRSGLKEVELRNELGRIATNLSAKSYP